MEEEAKLGRMEVDNVWDDDVQQDPQLNTPIPAAPSQDDGPNQEKYEDEVSCAGSELYNNEHNQEVSIITSTISGYKIVRKRLRDELEMENKLAKKSIIRNHRPEVLDQGKASNTPKPQTPELVNSTRALSKKKRCQERKDIERGIAPKQEAAAMSCRRMLNFNSLQVYQRQKPTMLRTFWSLQGTEDNANEMHSPTKAQTMAGSQKFSPREVLDVVAKRGECPEISNGGSQLMVLEQNAQIHTRSLMNSASGNPTKKKYPKPKVDLDHEDEDKHKEKGWEEQRVLFRGRVVSFIARTRLIQGARQFSPWKGSVVDSVVGAFLTQNVSDKNSSSAFMSLAARYPHRANDEIYPSTAQAADVIQLYSAPTSAARFTTEKSTSSKSLDDALDWAAIRCAKTNEVSKAIKQRGMNKKLAVRIKNCINGLVKEHGSIDLEWLREVPPDKAKKYLLSIEGLGLKSVECIRLLTLHHPAFPVDTHVGRIATRLGWVPIQPLPEGLQLHLLEEYPSVNSIQTYLWPRLCTLDQGTLYELHYQMITFGKVFCTKIKPNCNACPMRGECKHFASALASARLALPWPQEKSKVPSNIPTASAESTTLVTEQTPLGILEANFSESVDHSKNCQSIEEVPLSPGRKCTEILARDIEDLLTEDKISTVKIYAEEFVKNFVDGNNVPLQEYDTSKSLVVSTSEAASIPMTKLKNASPLRTAHKVYVLPDSHPLLEGLDKREPGDACPYLLAIWTAEEFCNVKECLSDSNIKDEQDIQTVRGTLLIPCRTAMKGRFPLNGTYFQVNEVFADDKSSHHPISVPTAWIWNLPKKTLYCGTSVVPILKDLSIEEIQHCFCRGFVCVRGFNIKTGEPKPLPRIFHRPVSTQKTKKRKKMKK